MNQERTVTPLPNSHTWPQWPNFAEHEVTAVVDVLKSHKINYWTGEQGRLFEKEFAEAIGTPYAIALMNGTVALEAALYALNIGPGDEVITTSRTFIASASSIVLRGATPVFADVDPISQNITAATIQAALTTRTKAIIVVHLAGWPCEMDSIMALAKKQGLYVIEDCAQAHGAAYKGRKVGSWGDVAAFSFCQDKIITTGGEGGMVTTYSREIWEKIWSFKDHGKSYQLMHQPSNGIGYRWVHESCGTNWRMTEMQSAIGRLQLRSLPEWLQIRRRNAAILNRVFSTLKILRLTLPPELVEHAYYKYYAFIRPEFLKKDWNRDRILQTIHAAGVPAQAGGCSEVYLENAFSRLNIMLPERLPVAKMLGETSVMFLVHPTLTEKNILDMATIAADIFTHAVS